MAESNPSVQLVAQYIKDLSVENPSPLELLRAEEEDIQTRMVVDVDASAIDEENFTVTISFKVEVMQKEEKGFLLELVYEGIFTIRDADEQTIPLLLFVQCPHLLFPSARHIIRTMTQEGGLPGFNINHVDFMALFRKKLENRED